MLAHTPHVPLAFDPTSRRGGRGASMHLFAGAGGDMQAAEMAGLSPVFAANHWTRAIETSSSNYTDVDHAIGDLSVVDPKRFKRGFANVLFASPECDGHSSARNHQQALRELAPYAGPDSPKSGIGRSRCTMWCPQRWAAYHRFNFVVMENVVDVVRWGAFASAGIPEPDLDFRPAAYCWGCETTVPAVQAWKPIAIKKAGPLGPAGKYDPRNQYLYRCPDCAAVCSPYITPACTAIEWERPAVASGDREAHGLKALEPNTIDRVRRGLAKFG